MKNRNKYGLIAVEVVENYDQSISLITTYKTVAEKNLETKSSQEKGCPKGAFLGLCQDGMVKGIPKGNYTKSIKNKQYALQAVDILKRAGKKTFTPKKLWLELRLGDKKSNSQMDVVLALWNKNLILQYPLEKK
jgi:hypothetical protein